MSETSTTHHKIKAEWTKASKNEIYETASKNSEKLEIADDESEKPKQKILILEQVVIYPSNNKSVKCHFCDKNFEKSFLDEHQKTHEKTFFNCSECDKKFKRKSSLRKHFNYLHKGKFKYECKDCKVKFIDLTKYEFHVNTKHKTKDSQRKYKCLHINCGKSFTSPEYLRRHQVMHTDEHKYSCLHCDQKFKWMTSLQIHQSIHNQSKSVVECKICFKRFFNHRSLERHQKIHKNVKFKCTLCEKVVSNRKDNIRRHIKHLHCDVERSSISNNITMVQGVVTTPLKDELKPHNESIDDSKDSTEKSIAIEQPKPLIIEPLPAINNRVKVIQSIGNPNRRHSPVQPVMTEVVPNDITSGVIEEIILPLKAPEAETELKLPPKKKAIALSQSTSSVQPSKPKYDPIQHYRKILLGFSKDDDQPATNDEHIIEEDDSGQETQVFPVHWRKRTSQNFLFRR